MELGLWLLFGFTVTSAAGKQAGRRASPGGSSHKRTLWLGAPGKGALWGSAFGLGLPPSGEGGGQKLAPGTTLEALEVATHAHRGDLQPGTTWLIFPEVGTFSKSLQTPQELCKVIAEF